MKTIVMMWVLLVASGSYIETSAQFWKKLQKKVEEKVEEKVIDKTSEKAVDITDKTMEKVLNPEFRKNSPIPIGVSSASMEAVPDGYDFEWVYSLKMETPKTKGALVMDYYLKPGAPYWGVRMQQAMQMFMVYDVANELTVIFMDQEGNRMVTATKSGMGNIDLESESPVNDYTMKEIAGKVVMGYDCKGFEMENDRYQITTYVTFDADVGFSNVYGNSKNIPKGFDSSWLKEGDQTGLMMEMVMKEKNKSKNNITTMTCTALEHNPFSISKADYNSYGQ